MGANRLTGGAYECSVGLGLVPQPKAPGVAQPAEITASSRNQAATRYCQLKGRATLILEHPAATAQRDRSVRQLRRRGLGTPVLMLTAKDAVIDRGAGLDSGADDYLVKPFAFKELLARLRALAWRVPTVAGPMANTPQPHLQPTGRES